MAIRVLIVDDSPFAREVLREVLSCYPDIEVIGEAGDGGRAESLVVELQPDVVTMDVIMPMVGGLEAIRAIMARCPTPIVLVSEAGDYDPTSLQAVEAGAIAAFAKPRDGFNRESIEQLVALIREAARIGVRQPWRHERVATADPGPLSQRMRQVEFVGIVASTGGPQTLSRLLGEIAAIPFLPIAIVQHTSVGFTDAFVSWLARASSLPVTVARDGQRIAPGIIAVAPDDRHLEIRPRGIAHLDDGPKLGSHRPSGTRLLCSLAVSYGAQAAGIVLTGMGNDGADGAAAIEKHGGLVFVEDPDTAILEGMPKAALSATKHAIVGRAHDIGRWLLSQPTERGSR